MQKEMILIHLICNNFVVFKQNTKQLLTPHTLLVGHISPLHPGDVSDGFTQPFARTVVIPLMDSCLVRFLATFEAPCSVRTLSPHKLQITDDECLTV
jgi:hypothetical protein